MSAAQTTRAHGSSIEPFILSSAVGAYRRARVSPRGSSSPGFGRGANGNSRLQIPNSMAPNLGIYNLEFETLSDRAGNQAGRD